MNKTLLVLQHEFRNTLKRRAFILLTLAFPLLGLLGIGIYQIVTSTEQPPAETIEIGYVDDVGTFNYYTEQYLVDLLPYENTDQATEALLDGDIEEYFVIPSDYIESGVISRFTLETEIEPPGNTVASIRDFLQSNLLEGQVSQDIGDRVKSPLALSSTVLDSETGQPSDQAGGISAFILTYVFALLLLMAIFTSSGYVLQGLGEEKENRIMEILLSSVSARQLITGKVLGLGAAGLTQMVIWLLSARLLVELLPQGISDVIGSLEIAPDFIILSLIYFILGYLLFAILMAGIGSIGATARESQQLSVMVIMPAIIPIYAIGFIVANPEHIVSQILTYFPFTAPTTVIMRLGIGEIPVWQLAISMAILLVTIYFSLILVAKIFRTFLLMYGKTPKMGEIVKMLRQA
jgi:ABC-2 type transport system permease protein